mmetsp:Transcript_35403/g.56930  ORF Transcript_35403/g.56930 Transcript_35403/m.56930 type:complete len:354 (+) Transcript_35403:195-1256(+)
MISSTAVAGSRLSSRILATAVSTGRLTLYLLARVITAPAVATPSATCVMLPRICSSDSPRPRRTPTVRFRLRLTKQVSMMSPVPDSPDSVSGLAPILPASHRISAHPCATSAAMALLPRFKPSTIPAAMASTFFSAPDISTPTTSVDVFTRRQLEPNKRCTRHASASSVDAATIAVGSPCISSTAKVGPDSTARGWSRPKPAGITSDIISQVPTSRPLARHRIGVLGWMCCFTDARNDLLLCTGTACMMKSAPPSAAAASVVARTLLGSSYAGRYLVLRWSLFMAAASTSLRHNMTTSRSALLRASNVAIAVPNEPPPITATLLVAPSTSSSFALWMSTRRDHRIILPHDSFT